MQLRAIEEVVARVLPEMNATALTENENQANIMTSLGTTPDNTSCDAELEILRQKVLTTLRAMNVNDPSDIAVHGR